ncbi:EpsG family protein [Flavobacterium piscinae]|uniref:EpsG family protein n=1 Tax=Flavobacterium piscinae TaxID=2506424 RepID=A0A4Q1KFX4_9FLAO|nr:EpsG family protein [Flavobacterium piscinae]RXR27727.1 EpsG family protein [Flavobacterium piscinae]
MNTLIPVEYYSAVYFNILLAFVLLVRGQAAGTELFDQQNLSTKRVVGIVFLFFVILFMGTRPISFTFADMAVYALEFKDYANGAPLNTDKEIVFGVFMKFCSGIMSAEVFFLLCAFLYVYPLYLASKKLFKDYWFYSLFILVISFSFWAYGTNGIRNGLATSLFIYALSRDKKWMTLAFIALSVSIHTSLIIPTIAYVISLFNKNLKPYLLAWFIAIPLSFAMGSFWENFFLGLGLIEEDRVIGYFSDDESYLDNIVAIKVGFRWDFLLYSAIGVFAGYYYIFRKKFEDVFYHRLFAIYLMCNTLWILVIRANFSNRFAYLSWFLLGLLVIYPLIKVKMFKQQHVLIGRIMLLYFAFTYVLNFVLGK